MFYNAAEAEFEIKRLQDCCQSYRAEIERLRTVLQSITNMKNYSTPQAEAIDRARRQRS